jgi:hypothetical protein
MHQKITKLYQLVTDRETVRLILNHLDPEGVQFRRQRRLRRRQYYSRGPNDLWHIDGWDKLKPFGFGVHGCIDGYSRRIIWLEVASTNNDPFVVCGYFADAIRQVGGLANVVRADRGTENVNVEQMQSFLRDANNDERARMNTTFLYGRSTANQRIEAWWSKFGQQGMTTWIQHFKELSDAGIVDTSDNLDIECCRFSYMDLLQQELDEIRLLWNTHHIRASRDNGAPAGKPDVMYYLPDTVGGVDCKQVLEVAELDVLAEIFAVQPPVCCETNAELFQILMNDDNRTPATTLDEAADNLVYLLDKLDMYLR